MLAELIPKLAAMDQDNDHPYYPRPSMASLATPDDPGRCVRAMVYHRLNTPAAPWPGRFLLVLDDSSWHEELSFDWLAKSSYRCHSRQMPVDFPLPRPLGKERYCARCSQSIPNTILHGHIDGIFTDLMGKDRLLEHKAVSMFAFDDLLAVGGHEQIKVRLAEIDAPEKAQPFGQRSTQALSDMVFGRTVRVAQQDKDRYGRVVGRVFVDGKDAPVQ